MKSFNKFIIFCIIINTFLFNLSSVSGQSRLHDHSHTSLENIHEEQVRDSIATIELLERTKKDYNLGNNTNKTFNCSSDNYDFENGTLNSWTTTNNVQMISGSSLDPYGLFPKVYPSSGSFSVKLGSDQGNYNGTLSRVIPVPSSGLTILSFHFALCVFNFPHNQSDAAKFSVKFYDENNQLLACPQYECYYAEETGPVGVPNMTQTQHPASFYNPSAEGDSPASYNVSWSGWMDVTIDLSAYAGQNITAVFDNRYCAYTPDWCYAYIEIECPLFLPSEILPICNELPLIVTAPTISGTYEWYNSSGTTTRK